MINLIHEGKVFEDCTVYLTGNAFYDCKFYRCTFVIREGGIPAMVGCHIECCVWHIDLMFSDHRNWDSFVRIMVPLVEQSLPRALTDQPGEGTPSPGGEDIA